MIRSTVIGRTSARQEGTTGRVSVEIGLRDTSIPAGVPLSIFERAADPLGHTDRVFDELLGIGGPHPQLCWVD